MKTKLKISTQTYYIATFLALFISGFALLSATQSNAVSAAPDNINQCYDSTTGSDVVFQMGHFVPNPDFEAATIQIDSVVKSNWNYTFFSGNGPGEISSLRPILENQLLSLLPMMSQ